MSRAIDNQVVLWSERMIARAIALQTFKRNYLVAVPNCNWTGHECDLLVVTENLRIIDVEVKISRADLKADAKKAKWWRHLSYDEALAKGHNGSRWDAWKIKEPVLHPQKVWKHYYAMPADIWKPELADSLPSSASGILLLHPKRPGDPAWHPAISVNVERRAKPDPEAKPISAAAAVDIARLASLRMWDAFEQLHARGQLMEVAA